MTTIPDREIYLAARSGDAIALSRLVGAHAPALHNVALWISGGDTRYAVRARRRAERSFARMVRHTANEEEALVELYRGFVATIDPRPRPGASDPSHRGRVADLPTREALALTLVSVAGLRHARVAEVLGVDLTRLRLLLHGARETVARASGAVRSGAEGEALGELQR